MTDAKLESRRLRLALILILAAPVMATASDIIVVMGVGAAPLTQDQLADIYLGRSNVLKPLDLPESNSTAMRRRSRQCGRL
jgi:hypothetical protein